MQQEMVIKYVYATGDGQRPCMNKHAIGVVRDWGHTSGDSHRLETHYMKLLKITAIAAPLQVNTPHLCFLQPT